MAKILPISEVKARLPELVASVQEQEEEIVITRNGRPAALLVNVDEHERLKETIEILRDPELMSQIRDSVAYFAAGGKGISFEEMFGEPLFPAKRRRKRRGP